jgi:DNA invertase Pin-like site-specific DNA recombinase
MRRFANRKEWNILSEFQEQFTGTKDSRPELNNAIERIKMYKRQGITVDFLLVTKIDRNTRGGSEVHFSIKTKLKDL